MVDCEVSGATGIYVHDEVGVSNPGSINATADADTVIIGGVVKEIEAECASRVSVNF